MKPWMKFYNDGKYTGDYSGDISINGSLDEFNCYMYVLEQPDFCLFRFTRDPIFTFNPAVYKPLDFT